mgnify:CR=1 FL=1
MLSLPLPKGLKIALRLAPLIVLLALVFLLLKPVVFSGSESAMYMAITVDLLLTLPVVYFFTIRKTSIPNISVVPVFIVGLVLGSLLIPLDYQGGINLAQTWVLPVVELTVISLVSYKVIALRKQFKRTDGGLDFMDRLRMAVTDTVPIQLVGALTTEVSMFYYALISWKKPILNSKEYSYHRNNASIAMLYALLLAILVETIAIHFILIQWSNALAWVFSALSVYTGLQVFALIKSIPRRPITLNGNQLVIRNGLLGDCRVELNNIAQMEVFRNDLPEAYDKMKKLSLFEQNLVFHFKDEITIVGLYGIRRKVKALAFYADEPEDLIGAINSQITTHAAT